MSLSDVKRAKKKMKAEAKRKVVQQVTRQRRIKDRIRQRHARKMIIDGRREFLAKRQVDKDYLAELELEIDGD